MTFSDKVSLSWAHQEVGTQCYGSLAEVKTKQCSIVSFAIIYLEPMQWDIGTPQCFAYILIVIIKLTIVYKLVLVSHMVEGI